MSIVKTTTTNNLRTKRTLDQEEDSSIPITMSKKAKANDATKIHKSMQPKTLSKSKKTKATKNQKKCKRLNIK